MRIPKRPQEATIVCELYQQLEEEGISAVAEYSLPGGGRADIALYGPYDDQVYALIEVKKWPNSVAPRPGTRQYRRYEETGLPWTVCRGMGGIGQTVRWAVNQSPDSD